MKIFNYSNVKDVYAAASQLHDELIKHGEETAAMELAETMKTYWTTSSEALGEIKLSLLAVRSVVEKSLNKEALQLLDSAVEGATRLWNGR